MAAGNSKFQIPKPRESPNPKGKTKEIKPQNLAFRLIWVWGLGFGASLAFEIVIWAFGLGFGALLGIWDLGFGTSEAGYRFA